MTFMAQPDHDAFPSKPSIENLYLLSLIVLKRTLNVMTTGIGSQSLASPIRNKNNGIAVLQVINVNTSYFTSDSLNNGKSFHKA